MGIIRRRSADIEPAAVANTPTLTIRTPGGHETVLQRGQRSSRPGSVEVCFVFDTTGSMSTKIDGLVACTVELVRELASLSIAWSVTAVPFGDLKIEGDTIEAHLPWHRDVSSAESMLRTLRQNTGGGNYGESSFEALKIGLSKRGDTSALRVIVLITDEAAHTDSLSPAAMVRAVVERDALVYSVATHHPYYRDIAEATGGSFVPIAATVDFSAIVEMFRRLASDIAGRSHKVLTAGGSPQRLLALESPR